MSYEFAEGYKIRNQGAMHYLTFTIEGWVDLLSRKTYKDALLESMNFCKQNKNLRVHAFVIMTNHLHVIWTAKDNNLSDVIRDFKTFTSKSFIKLIHETPESRREWLLYMFKFYARQTSANKEYKLWTNNNHPIELISEDFFYQKLAYIHNNPVRAGIVNQEKDYIYSSASNYANLKSIFEIDFL
jgi:putative transposase